MQQVFISSFPFDKKTETVGEEGRMETVVCEETKGKTRVARSDGKNAAKHARYHHCPNAM